MTTDKILHKLIGDIREQQVAGQAAIKLCVKNKYTEAKTLVICAKVYAQIDNILRDAEKEIK
jgi:hypothetical protein